MHLPTPENSSKRSQERPHVPKEGTTLQPQEIENTRRETEELVGEQRAIIDAQAAEILRLRASKERYAEGYRATKERIVELEDWIEEFSRTHKETLEKQDQRIRAMEDQLRRTEELSTKSTKYTEAKPFLSPSNRIAEAEVLGIVHDLNENVFQLAANLTDELEQFSSSRADRFTVTEEDINNLSQSYGFTLVQQALDGNPAAVTFLIQSSLSELATQITSSWRRNQELKILRSVCQLLSPSEGREISTRWRSLTQSHLSDQSSHSVSIARRVADILWITGSFPSARRAFDFVEAKASNGIKTIDRLVLRLESVFIVDIISSDMCLLFETPFTAYNDLRMAKEIDQFDDRIPGGEDAVAATTEVGVGKCVGERQGEGRRMEVLLKAKVVLEKDLTDL